MSTKNPPRGEGQQAKAHATVSSINQYQTHPAQQLPHEEDNGKDFSNQFPAQYFPRDPYDDTAELKGRNIAKNPYTGVPATVVTELTKEDLDYQKRKQDDLDNFVYKSWLYNTIDMTDPAQVQLAREKGVLNEYFDEREKLIDYWHDVSARIAKMRLLGRSEWGPEDYKLAYAIKSGVMKLPKGSLMNPQSYLDGMNTKNSINRGLFNPFRLFPTRTDKYLRTQEDPFKDLSDAPTQGDAWAGLSGVLPGMFGNRTQFYDGTPQNYSLPMGGLGSFHL